MIGCWKLSLINGITKESSRQKILAFTFDINSKGVNLKRRITNTSMLGLKSKMLSDHLILHNKDDEVLWVLCIDIKTDCEPGS